MTPGKYVIKQMLKRKRVERFPKHLHICFYSAHGTTRKCVFCGKFLKVGQIEINKIPF